MAVKIYNQDNAVAFEHGPTNIAYFLKSDDFHIQLTANEYISIYSIAQSEYLRQIPYRILQPTHYTQIQDQAGAQLGATVQDTINAIISMIDGNTGTGAFALIKYVANTYSDLITTVAPPSTPGITIGWLAYVYNSQGTAWLPGALGGTYYPNGFYVWQGTDWVSDRNAIAKALEDRALLTDPRFPTTSQKAALAGTSGVPSAINPYVTDGDARLVPATLKTINATSLYGAGNLVLVDDTNNQVNLAGNKTWTGIHTLSNGNLKLLNPTATFTYQVATSAIAANRVVILPLLTADDTFVTANFTQTLTNKTMSGLVNTFTNINVSSLVGSSALSKTDDTNVTLTFTGTPSTALIAAVNIAVGWTGTLSIARGGTGSAAQNFVDTSTNQAALAGNKTWTGQHTFSFNGSQVLLVGTGTYNFQANTGSNDLRIFETTVTNTKVIIGANAAPTATFQIRGRGTTTGVVFQLEDSAGTVRTTITDVGRVATSEKVTMTWATPNDAVLLISPSGNAGISNLPVVSITLGVTQRNVANDSYTGYRVSGTVTTSNTGQVFRMLDFGAITAFTYTANHTGAALRGFYWNPTIAGTQAAGVQHWSLEIVSGTAVFKPDVVIDTATKGLVLKDTQGTPHYWRVTVSNVGALVITDIGTAIP